MIASAVRIGAGANTTVEVRAVLEVWSTPAAAIGVVRPAGSTGAIQAILAAGTGCGTRAPGIAADLIVAARIAALAAIVVVAAGIGAVVNTALRMAWAAGDTPVIVACRVDSVEAQMLRGVASLADRLAVLLQFRFTQEKGITVVFARYGWPQMAGPLVVGLLSVSLPFATLLFLLGRCAACAEKDRERTSREQSARRRVQCDRLDEVVKQVAAHLALHVQSGRR